VEPRFITRLGDGSATALTRSELGAELEEGTQAAAAKAKLPPLVATELEHLLDIFASAARFSAVDIGDEVVLSFDGTGTPQQGSRANALLQYEQCLAADTCELYHIDYSYKAVKTIVGVERQAMKEAQERLTIPVHYGAQPDLGRYSAPDGPCGNWSELLPQMRIDDARAAQEEAVELAVEDMVYVATALWEAGADGINFDTAGAGGDADFLATLLAVERLRAAHADMGIMVGMSGELVWDAYLEGRVEDIRNYCETDVINTYLVYLRFELMRGRLTPEEHERECTLVRSWLGGAARPHLTEFLDAWAAGGG